MRRFCQLCLALLFVHCAYPVRAEQTVALDFDGVDIRTMIRFMSELSGQDYIVDNSVGGRVSVVSSRQIPLAQALEVMEAALLVNNFAVVSSPDGTHCIMPREQARLSSGSGGRARMRTRVFPLSHARAARMREIVMPLLSPAGVVSMHEGTNSLVVSESRGALAEIEKLIAKVDLPEAGPDKTRTGLLRLTNTVPSELAKIAERVYSSQAKTFSGVKDEGGRGAVTFVPDDAAGTLVFSAPQEKAEDIRAMLARLDAAAAQVFVEALIVEMSDGQTSRWGLELAAAGGAVFGTAAGFADTATTGLTKRILTGGDQTTTSAGYVDSTSERGGTVVPDIGALVSASRGSDDIRILSSPRLLTSNNEEARILVGQTVPFIRNSQVTAEGGTVRTFEFRDVGLLLKIMPNILSRDSVRLRVHQEVESVSGQSFEGAVETSKRMLSTMVTVRSGQTIVLGGLKSESKSEEIVRVPILGRIPLLGKIFTSEKKSTQTMNLFLLMTPTIISSARDMDAVRDGQAAKSAGLAAALGRDGQDTASTDGEK